MKETSMRGCLSLAPSWGPGRNPRMCPRLGIKPATLGFAGRHSATEPPQPGLFLSKDTFLRLIKPERMRGREASEHNAWALSLGEERKMRIKAALWRLRST